MDQTRNNTQSGEERVTRSVFWGTILLSAITLMVYAYFFTFLIQQPKTPVIYMGLGVFLFSFVSAVTSIVLTILHRQGPAAKLTFYTLFIMGLTITSVFQGRARTASFSILVISIIEILHLLPGQWRRWYSAVTATATIAMWGIEWINPSWRVEIAAATVGPTAVILFGLIFGVLLFLQTREAIANRFLSLSLRVKLLVSIVSITGLALLVYGIIFLYRTQQSQAFWSNELQTTVQEQSQQQITNAAQFEAHAADQSLSRITDAVQQLADYQSTLFTTESYLGQGGYWDGNSKLIAYPDGQHGNSLSEPGTIFIPNTATLSPRLLAELNTSRYLDFSAPAMLKENPNIVALYFDSAINYTVYYPNIDLVSLVPADFTPTAQTFYEVAAPENDPERKAKWTDPYQDPAGTGLIVTVSVPVYDHNDRFRGVMSADVQLTKISEQISAIKLGESGFAFLIDPSGHILAMPETGYKLLGIEPEVVPVGESPKTTILGLGSTEIQSITQRMVHGESGLGTAPIGKTQYYVAYYPLPTIGYSIALIAPTAELDAAYLDARERIGQETRLTTNLSILILVVVLLAAGGISMLLGQFLATPLTELTNTAIEVSKGNLNSKAVVRTSDEIGILASTFNSMTTQLSELIGSLEQRVAERTRNLELAATVGRAVSQVRDLNVMLKDACNLILKEFDLYYVQVYLTNPSQTALKLEAGTGSVGSQLVGRGHSLPFDISSINGRAAMEKQTVVISDTNQSATFRKNPLLPETRGEMAVPLIVADNVVGVLDMQSRDPGTLNEEVRAAFEALAGQLAVAIQNSNLLAETQEARAQVESQARRLVRAGWDEHLDAIHNPEQLGFVFDHNQITPLAAMDETQLPEVGKFISVPIAVTGEALGSLVVELEDETRAEQTNELVNIVARQVSQQIENLRLLESAERYRSEAEIASRRITREGWKSYVENADENLSYVYDLKEVRVPNKSDQQDEPSGYTLPLQVREETIGRLVVQGLDTGDGESVRLAHAVAERLGAHIESLRQYDQAQSALTQSEKLFEASSSLTQATDLQELVAASITTLGISEVNRALLVTFEYDTKGELEHLDVIANWWNRTGHEVTAIGTRYPLEVIRVMPMFISKTPVFFDDTLHDERVDATTLGLVKRLNLRAVAVLPLHVGSYQMGALILEAEEPHHFTQDETRLFSALAPQIATVVENRRQFEQAQKQAERESRLNVISQKIQSATTVEAVLQIAARELGHTLGAPLTIAQLGLKENANGN